MIVIVQLICFSFTVCLAIADQPCWQNYILQQFLLFFNFFSTQGYEDCGSKQYSGSTTTKRMIWMFYIFCTYVSHEKIVVFSSMILRLKNLVLITAK